MALRARGWRPPPPPLLLLLLWVTGQAAPVAGLGLGSDPELQIERRFVPDECPRTVRSGDFVRYHYVGTFPDGQKFDSRYRAPRAVPLPSLRTGLSLLRDLPQLRPAYPALLPLPPPTPQLPTLPLPPPTPQLPDPPSLPALGLPTSSYPGGNLPHDLAQRSWDKSRPPLLFAQFIYTRETLGRAALRGSARPRGPCGCAPAAPFCAFPQAPLLGRDAPAQESVETLQHAG